MTSHSYIVMTLNISMYFTNQPVEAYDAVSFYYSVTYKFEIFSNFQF